jgi:hypothetical protein
MVSGTTVEICMNLEAYVGQQVHRTGSGARRCVMRIRLYLNRKWSTYKRKLALGLGVGVNRRFRRAKRAAWERLG